MMKSLAKLEQGRDRLLEINSFRPQKAQEIIDTVEGIAGGA